MKSDNKGEFVKGRLFGNRIIRIHPDTLGHAATWQETTTGVATLDQDVSQLLRVFDGLCGEHEQPFVIDVGANVGTFSLVGAHRKDVRGWAFEPHATVYEILRRNIALNGMGEQLVPRRIALANYSGRRVLKSPFDDRHSFLSCLGQPNFGSYKEQYVDVVRLDDLIASNAVPTVDIMVIDCEGAELFVLIGATETLHTHKPDILLSVNWATLTQFGVYANNLADYLELQGYHGHWVGAEHMLFRHPRRKPTTSKGYFTAPAEKEGLKIALVKQRYDVFGPWRNEKYDDAAPLSVLKKWPSKCCYFEMTHLFHADWYILPFCHDSKIVRRKIDYHQQTFDDYAEYVRNPDEIPFDDYDVVISLDPILRPPRGLKSLFAYFQNEHHNSEYEASLKGPLPGYDLFLDHMMKAPHWVYNLPQPVSFPYPRSPFSVRRICGAPKTDAIWFDKRFVMMLAHGNEAFDRGGFDSAVAFLEKKFKAPVRFRYLDFEDMTRWGDPLEYLQAMAGCAYYVNLIACGAGQGLCDAASLGLICFGSPKLPYHRMICHPLCLCRDLAEFEMKYALVRDSADLRAEIISWQDAALSDRMVTQPLRMLQAGVEKKLSSALPAKDAARASHMLLTTQSVDELLPDIARINLVKIKTLAQAELRNEQYEEVLHRCVQALWFDESDHEIHYLASVAHYALKDMKNARAALARCLEIKNNFNPALTLQRMIALEPEAGSEDGRYEFCRNRVLCLIYNGFSGFNREVDGPNMDLYNSILDEVLAGYIEDGDQDKHAITLHHKMRLNRIASL